MWSFSLPFAYLQGPPEFWYQQEDENDAMAKRAGGRKAKGRSHHTSSGGNPRLADAGSTQPDSNVVMTTTSDSHPQTQQEHTMSSTESSTCHECDLQQDEVFQDIGPSAPTHGEQLLPSQALKQMQSSRAASPAKKTPVVETDSMRAFANTRKGATDADMIDIDESTQSASAVIIVQPIEASLSASTTLLPKDHFNKALPARPNEFANKTAAVTSSTAGTTNLYPTITPGNNGAAPRENSWQPNKKEYQAYRNASGYVTYSYRPDLQEIDILKQNLKYNTDHLHSLETQIALLQSQHDGLVQIQSQHDKVLRDKDAQIMKMTKAGLAAVDRWIPLVDSEIKEKIGKLNQLIKKLAFALRGTKSELENVEFIQQMVKRSWVHAFNPKVVHIDISSPDGRDFHAQLWWCVITKWLQDVFFEKPFASFGMSSAFPLQIAYQAMCETSEPFAVAKWRASTIEILRGEVKQEHTESVLEHTVNGFVLLLHDLRVHNPRKDPPAEGEQMTPTPHVDPKVEKFLRDVLKHFIPLAQELAGQRATFRFYAPDVMRGDQPAMKREEDEDWTTADDFFGTEEEDGEVLYMGRPGLSKIDIDAKGAKAREILLPAVVVLAT